MVLGRTEPDGTPYTNTDKDWLWLSGGAGKAPRWLGYIPFDQIVDQRNAPRSVDKHGSRTQDEIRLDRCNSDARKPRRPQLVRGPMPYRPTGAGAFGFSLNWEKVPGDKEVARRVVTFLEDRRLLFGERHVEDEMHCVYSAIDIRRFLTEELTKAKPGRSLAESLRAMRTAMRGFVEAAGPDAIRFQYHPVGGADLFSLALGDLRSLVGVHLAVIAGQYGIEVEPDLARIFPPDISADDDTADPRPSWEDWERPDYPPLRWKDTVPLIDEYVRQRIVEGEHLYGTDPVSAGIFREREYERYMRDPERPAFLTLLRAHVIRGRPLQETLDAITGEPLNGLPSIAAELNDRLGEAPPPVQGES